MAKNMGSIDRLIRVVLAGIVAALYFAGQMTGMAAVVLGGIAAVFVLTSAVGTCPLYAPLGISTRGR